MYVVYNVHMVLNPEAFEYDNLWKVADTIFFVSAVFYLVGAMRDTGVMFWIPLDGCRSYGVSCDEEDDADGCVHGGALVCVCACVPVLSISLAGGVTCR